MVTAFLISLQVSRRCTTLFAYLFDFAFRLLDFLKILSVWWFSSDPIVASCESNTSVSWAYSTVRSSLKFFFFSDSVLYFCKVTVFGFQIW